MAEYIKREDAINLLWLYADESCASVVSDFENLPAADDDIKALDEIFREHMEKNREPAHEPK